MYFNLFHKTSFTLEIKIIITTLLKVNQFKKLFAKDLFL